jgi:hypothetical protein
MATTRSETLNLACGLTVAQFLQRSANNRLCRCPLGERVARPLGSMSPAPVTPLLSWKGDTAEHEGRHFGIGVNAGGVGDAVVREEAGSRPDGGVSGERTA